MFKKILKRAMAEAMHGGYRSGKPWKKGKYGRHWHGTGYGPAPDTAPMATIPTARIPRAMVATAGTTGVATVADTPGAAVSRAS